MSELIRSAKDDIAAGNETTTTVRKLLHDFGGQRRRANIVETIRKALREAGLVTDPDFTSAWIDAEIAFKLAPSGSARDARVGAEQFAAGTRERVLLTAEPKEALQPIRMLSAANRGKIA